MTSDAEILSEINIISEIEVVPKILEVICRSTGMGFAVIARVTDKEWVACSVLDEIEFGLKPGGSLVLETTICHEIQQHHSPVVIDNVSMDAIYSNHHTPKMYGFQSYISIPIFKKNGQFFGTLCAIDPRPAKLNNPEIIGMFQLYADLISFHLDHVAALQMMEGKLKEEQELSLLRDQFIAILGHDLRNPVTAVLSGAQILKTLDINEQAKSIAQIIQNSSYRMTALIENMLDFARGSLGGGIKLNPISDFSLKETLHHVVKELVLAHPDKDIELKIDITNEVYCDGRRIAQLFSNILSNALNYGSADKPVVVEAYNSEKGFVLSVCNTGKKIPEAIIPHLFKPFSRGAATPGQQGLGLGLFIAGEIAAAHNGTIDVSSTEE
jgi:signal transduction histidine kinase